MTRFWIANAVIVILLYAFLPHLWQRVSILYLVLVSLYANAATDAGAGAAANASTEDSITQYAIREDED